VQDNGSGNLNSQASATILLLNVNESPIVNNQTFNIGEFAANATLVGTIIASDPDAGQILNYVITSGNTGNAFAVNPVSGNITVNNSAVLDFQINPVFNINIRVTDDGSGNLYDDALITINILQSQNQPPAIYDQFFTLDENSPDGMVVGNVIATDPDPGQTLTYSILSGNINNAFAVNSANGEITVANSGALNYEVINSFLLVIKVQDNGVGSLSSQSTITVNLVDLNEPPVVNDQLFSIIELSANGTTVGLFTATDPDAEQILTYDIISGNLSNAFAINSNNGEITVADSVALNFLINPVFNLIVRVTDDGLGNLYTEAIVTVNLLQNINQSPVINNQSFWVTENSPTGSVVDTISATDPDEGQTLFFSILTGNTGSAFSIDSITGILTVNNPSVLDFETNPVFNLLIIVTDNGSGSLFDDATVTVDVLPIPNYIPVVSNQAFSLNENSTNGTLVGTIIASDPDAGQILTYSILSGNINNAFSINTTTGDLMVSNSGTLNFEGIPSYTLIVNVQDNGMGNLSNQATIIVTLIDVNEAPVADDQIFSITELASNGTQVGIVTASDPDNGQILSYSITSGNLSNAFTLNPSNGILTVNNSAALNFQTNPVFDLNVRATDNGPGNLFDDAFISVNVLQNANQPPQISDQVFRIDENSPDGSFVGTINATDPDPGQSLTYSIVSGNINGAFTINTLSGEVLVANTAILNYEVINLFNLIIQVQDNGTGNLSTQASIIITLLDINEPPVAENGSFNIFESALNGTLVGIPTANDPDTGQTLSFAIVSGNTDNAFAINPADGSITVDNPTALNFQVNPIFSLIIRVTDDGESNLFDDATINIRVLQNPNQPPVINAQTFQVNENSSYGTSVGTVVAMDPDAGQNLEFSILSGNLNNAFAINDSSGKITVNNSAALNFELTPFYQLVVSVKDNGSGNLTADARITVTLLDINESPVIADQAFELMENSGIGTLVGKLIASDPDAGQTLSYSIISGNSGNTFILNSLSGILSVANPALLVYATNPVFTLQVTAHDNGPGTLTTTAYLTINLIQNTDHFVYVDPSQINSPEENGSIQHPFNSWTDVIFSDGYSYFQKRGTTYVGTSNITIYSKNNITIDAYGTGNPPIIQNTIANSRIIDLSSSKNCTIRNLELNSSGNALCCIYLSGNLSSEITIENCNLHDALYGIRSILKGNGLHIINCSISKIGLDGIYAANFQNIEIGNCTIYDVNQKWFQNPNASESTGDCIELNSTSGTVNIHHNTLTHISTGNMAVVAISGSAYSGLIEGNTLTGNRLTGNECLRLNSSTKTMVIRYNTISGGLNGINTNVASCLIYYNQFLSNTVAIRIQKNKPADIKNNTFFGNINYSIESLSGSSVTSRNNIFYLDALAFKVYKFGGSNVSNYNTFNIEKPGFLNGYSTLSSWSNATNQDRNSMTADPLFVNIIGSDFRIQIASPCINKGTNLNLPRDFFGISVPQSGVPDMGFHEVESTTKNNIVQNIVIAKSSATEISAKIYPNPSNGIFHISIENPENAPVAISVNDINGKIVANDLFNGDSEITVNLENQNAGIYIAVITINGQVLTRKIIIQN
jgi:hypothetical protein